MSRDLNATATVTVSKVASKSRAGGGITPGQVIGATDRRGEEVVSRRVGPQDFLATIYSHLGIDYEKAALPDFTGRPVPIVRDGKAITELVSA